MMRKKNPKKKKEKRAKSNTPDEGLEPSALRLKVSRANQLLVICQILVSEIVAWTLLTATWDMPGLGIFGSSSFRGDDWSNNLHSVLYTLMMWGRSSSEGLRIRSEGVRRV